MVLRNRSLEQWVSTIGLLFAALLLAGCGGDGEPLTSKSTNYEVADAQPSTDTAPVAEPAAGDSGPSTMAAPPAAASAARPESAPIGTPIQPPAKPPSQPPVSTPAASAGDTPKELLALIRQLQSTQPEGTTREQVLASFRQNMNSIVLAAEKVMEGSAPLEMVAEAAQAKAEALTQLLRTGDEAASQRLSEYTDQLSEHEVPEVARVGIRMGFASKLNAVATGELSDIEEFLTYFDRLIASEKIQKELVGLGREVATILEGSGQREAAVQVLQRLATALEASEDEETASAAIVLREHSEMVGSGVREKLNAVLTGEPESAPAFLEAATALLASDKRGRETAAFLLQQGAFNLEMINPQAADELFRQLGEAFGDHQDGQVAEMVNSAVDKYQKRASLLGKPFTVEGVTFKGEPFDWATYQGKVVLVDFWATWCGPCLAEIPNIKRNYEQFKDVGFEVVGINLDSDPQSVERFFSLQQLPWPTVLAKDPETRGMDTPLAIECGIEFIPFIVLVGRDGTVQAINVRGEELGPKLAELLGGEAAATSDESTGE